jgi:hypothetical protein
LVIVNKERTMTTAEPLVRATDTLAAAYALLAAANLRGSGEDRALDILLAAEDAILATPIDRHEIVAARAHIAIRRLMVASEDRGAPEWGLLMGAVLSLLDDFQEAANAIETLLPIALTHRDAIIRGNSADGTRAGLDPDRAAEVEDIDGIIEWSCCLAELDLPEAEKQGDMPEPGAIAPVLIPATPPVAKPEPKPRSRAKTQPRRKARAKRTS